MTGEGRLGTHLPLPGLFFSALTGWRDVLIYSRLPIHWVGRNNRVVLDSDPFSGSGALVGH